MSTNITASTDLSTVATKDLVAFHNEHAESPVKKFATRAKAEERVAALLAEMKPKKRGKKKDKPATDVDRSAAIASSWADPSVRAARTARHPVKVKGIVYRSVRAAFAELGLPDNQHQKFRKELVEKGRATFDGHIFTIVEAE